VDKDKLLVELKSDHRGSVFLWNLDESITSNLVDPLKVAEEMDKFCVEELQKRILGLTPRDGHVVDRLGQHFVSQEVWKSGSVPDLSRHGLKSKPIISRVVPYATFFDWVVGRKDKGGVPGLPEHKVDGISDQTFSPEEEEMISTTLSSNNWQRWVMGKNIKFDQRVYWFTALPELEKIAKLRKIQKTSMANFHRSVIGLHHIEKNLPLVRLDLHQHKIQNFHALSRYRPHGACNGGFRFKVKLDKDAKNWGMTADLEKIAAKTRGYVAGVPEMLLEGFEISKEHVKATYLGHTNASVEVEHDFFISKLSDRRSLDQMVDRLASVLK
jgi:hypothetical protein